MSNEKIVFNISDFQSARLQGFATAFDTDGEEGLSLAEREKLQNALNGNASMKAELAKESDDVKELFGLTTTAKTEAKVATNPNKDLENYSKAKQEYIELRKAGKGPYEAYKEVKKAHKDDKEFKHAIKALKNYAKNVDSQIDTIEEIGKSEATKSKQVKRDAKAGLAAKDGGKIDKWHKRAVNGSNNFVTWVSGEDSAMKEIRKGQAWGNRAKQIEKDGVSMEDIVKKLGKNCPYLQTTESGKTLLEEAGLIKKREDGVYDITELSHFIQNMGTGGDNNQSRQENKSVREAKLNIAELNTLIKEKTGVDLSHTRIKDKYSKRLVRLTGRHVEKKNVLGAVYANAVGGALAAAAGTVGALLLQRRDVTIVRNSNTNYLELNLNIEGANIGDLYDSFIQDEAFAGLIDKGEAALTQTSEGIQVIIDQRNAEEFVRIADKHLLSNALKSAAIGGAIGLLASALTYGKSEQEVIPHVTDCKTLDEFNTYIDSMVTNKGVKPLYGEIAKRIAVAFSNADGTIKCDEMNKFLGYQASNGSRLNRAELMAALNNLKDKLDNTPVDVCYEIEKQVEKEKDPDVQDDVATIHHAAKYGWTNLGRMYSCFDDMTDQQAWRAMQVIQAIDPDKVGGKYREDQIIAIARKAFTNNGNGKPDWNYINNELANEFSFVKVDTLKSVLKATYAGTEVTPAEKQIKQGQEGYDKVNIVIAPITLYNADGTEACKRKDPNRDRTHYAPGNGTANNKVKVSTHYTLEGAERETSKFRATSQGVYTDWKSTEAEADADAKARFPKARKCK